MTKVPAILTVTLVSLVACAASTPPVQDEPSNFHILSEPELQHDMQSMADRITAIAFLTLDENLTPAQKRSHVVPLLNSIEVIATEIGGGGATTNYSVVNRYMGSFLYDVSVARNFALRSPPNLVPAQRLIKSCLSCHESI